METILCYFVASVISLASLKGIEEEKFTFGVKQITEELVAEEAPLCEDGEPIYVTVESIKAPTQGIQIGPFKIKQKKTTVTVLIKKDGEELRGEGVAKMKSKSMMLQLQDENLPFEQTEFSIAVKKAIEDALD
ncbi:hypothetical protein N9H63_00825 [bacterium]|nr:hypothetical protein [bacterium]